MSENGRRLQVEDITRISKFVPWWVQCVKCSHQAYMTPNWKTRNGQCKCVNCGAVYRVEFSTEYSRLFTDLPLWLKADFRGNVFWALNGEHLNQLERIIRATSRERPITPMLPGRRFKTTTNMPFNLPSWLLSAKNRPDLLRLIARLRKTLT